MLGTSQLQNVPKTTLTRRLHVKPVVCAYPKRHAEGLVLKH